MRLRAHTRADLFCAGGDDFADCGLEGLHCVAGDEPGDFVGYAVFLEGAEEAEGADATGEDACAVVRKIVVGVVSCAEEGGQRVEVEGQGDFHFGLGG